MKLLRFACLITLATLFAAARPTEAQFINVDVPGVPPNSTVVTGINNNGMVVGWFFGPSGQQGFTYNLNTNAYAVLANPSGFENVQLTGINDNNDLVGTATSTSTFAGEGIFISGATGNVNVISDPIATCCTQPSGVNDGGKIIGNFIATEPTPGSPGVTESVFHGFALTGGTFTTDDFPGTGPGPLCPGGSSFCNPPGGGTFINAINNAGVVVGVLITSVFNGQAVVSQNQGWLVSPGSPIPLQISFPGFPTQTMPTGINNNGVIVGSYIDASCRIHGFSSPGGVINFTTVDEPNVGTNFCFGTQPTGVNDNGVIVGNYEDTAGVSHGFVDIPGGGPPTDVSAEVSVTRSGFRFQFTGRVFFQTDTLTNNSANPITSPIYLVLDSLSPNAHLTNLTGTTSVVPPVGSPFITVIPPGGSLAAGASISVSLQFNDPSFAPIIYSTSVLAGGTTLP